MYTEAFIWTLIQTHAYKSRMDTGSRWKGTNNICIVTIKIFNHFFSLSDVLYGLRIVFCKYTFRTHSPYPCILFFNLHTFAFINYSIITIVHQKNKKKDKKRKEITNMPKINQYEMLTTLNTAHCHNVSRICVLCHVMSL